MKVLFIQEQTFLTTALRLALQTKGYELIVFNDKVCPQKAIEAHNPGIIIADISGGSGLNYVEEGKRHNIPVLVICSSAVEDALQNIFAKGASDCMSLPFSSADLATRLNTLTQKAKVA